MQSNCCGVLCYVDDLIEEGKIVSNNQKYPIVRSNGEYLFEVKKTGDYETSVISPIDGKKFVVHDG